MLDTSDDRVLGDLKIGDNGIYEVCLRDSLCFVAGVMVYGLVRVRIGCRRLSSEGGTCAIDL